MAMRASQNLLAGLLISTWAAACLAQSQVEAKHARVELLSMPVARNQVQLGVHFTLEQSWHIYWVNPGDSGQPPSFQWTLPNGATAGEIQWPRPERLQNSPDIADYGYKDDVLLIVPVHLTEPPNKSSGTKIGLEAKWLICREVCLPDRAQLSLSLSSGGSPGMAELFARTKAMLPRQWPKEWRATALSHKDDFVLTLITGRPLTRAQFFPLDPGQIDNSAKQPITPTSNGARLLLRKSDLLLKPIQELRGVLVIGSNAYQLRAPVIARVALK
jgi:thiol:disulfide interchange protein DsbD